jgi:hypothetical protein
MKHYFHLLKHNSAKIGCQHWPNWKGGRNKNIARESLQENRSFARE